MTPLSSNRNTPQFDPVVKPSGQETEVQRQLEDKTLISPKSYTALFDSVVKPSGQEAEGQRQLEDKTPISSIGSRTPPVSFANDSRQVGEEKENGNGLQLQLPASRVQRQLEDKTPISSIGSRTPPVSLANDSRQVGEEQESHSDLNLQGPTPEVQMRKAELKRMRAAFKTGLASLKMQLRNENTDEERGFFLKAIHEYRTMKPSAPSRNLAAFRCRYALSIETDEQAVDRLTKEINRRYENWEVLDKEVAPLFLERAWFLFHLNRFEEACKDFEFVIKHLPSRAGEAQKGINECFKASRALMNSL